MGRECRRIRKFSARAAASVTLPAEEYIEGIETPTTFSGPSAATARAQVTAESIPPESPTRAPRKPHLAA
jgi:hypothetical protein